MTSHPQPKIAFFGTDEFSIGVAEQLVAAGFKPLFIVTVPDQPIGRHQFITPPPFKRWAIRNAMEFIQPARIKETMLNGSPNPVYQKLKDFDVFIVASYGQILPQALLDLPAKGTLNVHPSLLPKYRGPAPIEAPILNGDTETGVSIMLLDAEIDHGPLLAKRHFELDQRIVASDLRDRLANLGGRLLTEVLPGWLAGKLEATPQNHNEATGTKKITKDDGLVNLTHDTAEMMDRKFRALSPWPGIYFFHERKGQRLRVLIKDAFLHQGRFFIKTVLPEGRSVMSWDEFQRNFSDHR